MCCDAATLLPRPGRLGHDLPNRLPLGLPGRLPTGPDVREFLVGEMPVRPHPLEDLLRVRACELAQRRVDDRPG